MAARPELGVVLRTTAAARIGSARRALHRRARSRVRGRARCAAIAAAVRRARCRCSCSARYQLGRGRAASSVGARQRGRRARVDAALERRRRGRARELRRRAGRCADAARGARAARARGDRLRCGTASPRRAVAGGAARGRARAARPRGASAARSTRARRAASRARHRRGVRSDARRRDLPALRGDQPRVRASGRSIATPRAYLRRAGGARPRRLRVRSMPIRSSVHGPHRRRRDALVAMVTSSVGKAAAVARVHRRSSRRPVGARRGWGASRRRRAPRAS